MVFPALVSVVLVLLWWRLGDRFSLWMDEADSVDMTRQPLGALAHRLFFEHGNMGPYYYLLWFWAKIDAGAHWLRGMSAAGMVAAVWGIWALLRRWSGPVVAAAGVVAFAANPFALSWMLQARAYTWMMAATVWALLLADRLAGSTRRTDAVLLGLCCGLGAAMSPAAAFPAVVFAVWLLLKSPTGLMFRRVALAAVSAAAAFGPFAWAYVRDSDQLFWVPKPDARMLLEETLGAFGGRQAAVLFAVVAALGLPVVLLRRPAHRVLLPAAAAASVFAGVLAVTVVAQPLFIARYLSPALPLLVVALTGVCASIHPRVGAAAAAVFAVAAVFAAARTPGTFTPLSVEDYRTVAAEVLANADPGDMMVVVPELNTKSVRYNWPEGQPMLPLLTVDPDGPVRFRDEAGRPAGPKRLWLIQRGEVPSFGIDPRVLDEIFAVFETVVDDRSQGPIITLLLEDRTR